MADEETQYPQHFVDQLLALVDEALVACQLEVRLALMDAVGALGLTPSPKRQAR